MTQHLDPSPQPKTVQAPNYSVNGGKEWVVRGKLDIQGELCFGGTSFLPLRLPTDPPVAGQTGVELYDGSIAAGGSVTIDARTILGDAKARFLFLSVEALDVSGNAGLITFTPILASVGATVNYPASGTSYSTPFVVLSGDGEFTIGATSNVDSVILSVNAVAWL